MLFSKVVNKIKDAHRLIMLRLKLAILIIGDVCIFVWRKKMRILKDGGKNNIIMICNLFNKGGQAMIFMVVDQMKKRFPNKNIYLFSTRDFKRECKEKNIYTFHILPWDFKIKMKLLTFLKNPFKRNIEQKPPIENEVIEVIKNADFFIDISGYALSSEWGWFQSFDYLLNIMVAKRFCVSYYIFPQSIGPFNYRLRDKIFLHFPMKIYLKYPKKIFAREKEGLQWLHKFTKKNIEKSCDIVLHSQKYDVSNIYNRQPHLKDIKVMANSVGIIPNARVVERSNAEYIYSLYNSLINKLINADKHVYILRHSYEDLRICETLKCFYPDNPNIRLIPDDLNVTELENVIKQFDFIIASRYHSIIHAYKNGVPALVIGWTKKYSELLAEFNQSNYLFDIRYGIDSYGLANSLDRLMSAYSQEREKIADRMNSIGEENVFNVLDKN